MRHPILSALIGLSFCGAFAPPAMAQRLTDPPTGLSVDPPAGYVASSVTARPPNAANLLVQSRRDPNTGCQLVFTPTPDNARFSQAELNAIAARPAWRENALRTLSSIYTIEQAEPFQHAGIDGFVAEAMLRPREGIPAEAAASVRTLLVMLESPTGRTSAICVGPRSEFSQRRGEFIAIIRSTTPGRPVPTGGIRP